MKFYYACIYKHLYEEDEDIMLTCSYSQELKKEDIVVIEYCNKFIAVSIKNQLDELTVIAKRHDVREVLAKVETSEYSKKKENTIKRQQLLNQMEEKSKEVKLIENMKKCASNDPDMAKMLELFNELNYTN